MGNEVKAGMPKWRGTQAGERDADADAAALVVKVIIANRGAGICGKRLLLESGLQNPPAGENLYDTNLKPASHQASQKLSSGTKQNSGDIPVSKEGAGAGAPLLLHS